MADELQGTKPRKRDLDEPEPPLPGLLVAHAPRGAVAGDRFPTEGSGSLGRVRASTVRAQDNSVSRSHFQFWVRGGRAYIQDYGSTNGTFVDGQRAGRETEMADQAVIRAGRLVLVFHHDLRPFLDRDEIDTHGIAGRFHAPLLVEEIDEAVRSGRNLLLSGPSGSGRFSSADEAMTTLFGAGQGVFTDVKERDGYIARADGGVLFLDEAHVLPERVQKALLRVVEDGRLARIGETDEREVDVRFVLASNEPGPTRGLAEDLLNRLREVRVPPLADRRADIPSIFRHLIERQLDQADLDIDVDQLLNEYHHEALILDGFERKNVRGLGDIAERIATRIASGTEPAVAVREVFAKRYAAKYPAASQDKLAIEPPRTTYEVPRPDYLDADDKTLVMAAFERQGGNAAAIKRDLRRQGYEISERRVRRLLDELGLPRIKRGK
jgi:pSer/pThr/pTyr-binding forkhead associated (FHA) protein